MGPDEETTAVTAHWLLGRLSALQGMLEHIVARDDLGRDTRIDLLTRLQLVSDQMRIALEALARGHDHPLVDLTADPLADIVPDEIEVS